MTVAWNNSTAGEYTTGGAVTVSGLQVTMWSSSYGGIRADTGRSASGDWVFEVALTNVAGQLTNAPRIGVSQFGTSANNVGDGANEYGYQTRDATKWIAGSSSSYGVTGTTGDKFLVRLHGGTLTFYKYLVSPSPHWESLGDAVTGLSGTFYPHISGAGVTLTGNFGASSFAGGMLGTSTSWDGSQVGNSATWAASGGVTFGGTAATSQHFSNTATVALNQKWKVLIPDGITLHQAYGIVAPEVALVPFEQKYGIVPPLTATVPLGQKWKLPGYTAATVALSQKWRIEYGTFDGFVEAPMPAFTVHVSSEGAAQSSITAPMPTASGLFGWQVRLSAPMPTVSASGTTDWVKATVAVPVPTFAIRAWSDSPVIAVVKVPKPGFLVEVRSPPVPPPIRVPMPTVSARAFAEQYIRASIKTPFPVVWTPDLPVIRVPMPAVSASTSAEYYAQASVKAPMPAVSAQFIHDIPVVVPTPTLSASMLAEESARVTVFVPAFAMSGRFGGSAALAPPVPTLSVSITSDARIEIRIAVPMPTPVSTVTADGIITGLVTAPMPTAPWAHGTIEFPQFWVHGSFVGPVSAATAFATNLSSNETTRYTNYDFSWVWRVFDSQYAVRADGVYELAGSTDAGGVIDAVVETHPTDFASDDSGNPALHLKRLPSLYAQHDGDMEVESVFDGSRFGPYRSPAGQGNKRIVLARGPKGRQIAVSLRNIHGGAFRLDSLELPPDILKRKI